MESVFFLTVIIPLNWVCIDWLNADAVTITAQNNNVISLLFIYNA